MIEDTTVWADGQCVRCGGTSATQYDGGVYCDGCARRVARWEDVSRRGEDDG